MGKAGKGETVMSDVRIGFMSSVAPHWSLDQLIAAAKQYGFDGIELRVQWGHAFKLELDSTKAQRNEARRKFTDAGVVVSCLALSARLAQATDEARDAQVDEVARYAELAADLGAPAMRVFGGPIPEGFTMATLRDKTAAAFGKAAAKCAGLGVTPCLETHDVHNNPEDVAYIIKTANHPNLGVVWHAAHHMRLGISAADAYKQLKPYVRHCHISEGPRTGQEHSGDAPIPLGSGNGNVFQVMKLLKADGFTGVMSWEWINAVRSFGPSGPTLGDLLDPNPHLAQFAGKLKEYQAALR